MMNQATLITGGNIGHSEEVLALACKHISERVGKIVASSKVHRTAAWGFEGDDFLNQVLVVETLLEPLELLDVTQEIERDMGRTQKSVDGGYQSRVIDIDILYYNEIELCHPRLTIPHPHIDARDFVLVPLGEVEHLIKRR